MNELNAGTLSLTDDELVRAIESCALESAFHHADHVRIAWIYLRAMPAPQAVERMCTTLKRFAAGQGKLERYHHTMTLAWMRLVSAALRTSSPSASFAEFISTNLDLEDQGTLARYFSAKLLSDPISREAWVEPDLAALPALP